VTHAVIAAFDRQLAALRHDAELVAGKTGDKSLLAKLDAVAAKRDAVAIRVAEAVAEVEGNQATITALGEQAQALDKELRDERYRQLRLGSAMNLVVAKAKAELSLDEVEAEIVSAYRKLIQQRKAESPEAFQQLAQQLAAL
jgi:hypothetical protein